MTALMERVGLLFTCGFRSLTSAACSPCIIITIIIIIDRKRRCRPAVVVQGTMQGFGGVINVADPAALFYLQSMSLKPILILMSKL